MDHFFQKNFSPGCIVEYHSHATPVKSPKKEPEKSRKSQDQMKKIRSNDEINPTKAIKIRK
ncbi:hypothetical protein CN378_17425 [Bacillus sp. AFS015802]|nr:hypothetical protein CN378_17425 [Bacillus sp. AFS015802]